MSETASAAEAVDVVHRHRLRDELRLEVPALREEGTDRTVDHARRQRRLLTGAGLATEERAGDLARGVVALLDVDGQGEEIDVAEVSLRRGGEDHGVPGADHDGTARLLCELAGLERDLVATHIRRDPADFEPTHLSFSLHAATVAATQFRTLVL